MALSLSKNESVIGVSNRSNSCVPAPQRIISEHSALTARSDLVNELPCIVALPGLCVPTVANKREGLNEKVSETYHR